MAKKKTPKGQWCLTVDDLLNFLKLKKVNPKASISMADGMNIYVVPGRGKVTFTDLDDDGNEMAVEE